jgi:hypothetical protein
MSAGQVAVATTVPVATTAPVAAQRKCWPCQGFPTTLKSPQTDAFGAGATEVLAPVAPEDAKGTKTQDESWKQVPQVNAKAVLLVDVSPSVFEAFKGKTTVIQQFAQVMQMVAPNRTFMIRLCKKTPHYAFVSNR